MSHWTRRRAGKGNSRTISLPIFFSTIDRNDQQQEIVNSVRAGLSSISGNTVTINWSCLGMKGIPVEHLAHLRAVHEYNYTSYTPTPTPTNTADTDRNTADTEDRDRDTRVSVSPPNMILNVEVNLVEELPEDLFEIGSIICLFLRSNKISYISHSIWKLKKLGSLTLANNPIRFLPVEILSLPLTDLTYSSNHLISEDEVKYLNSKITQKPASLADICIRSVCKRQVSEGKKSEGAEMGSMSQNQGMKRLKMCSVCKSQTQAFQLMYKMQRFREASVPFEYVVCSDTCVERVKRE